MARRAAALALAAAALSVSPAQSLYEDSEHVVALDKESFTTLVENTQDPWIVHPYDPESDNDNLLAGELAKVTESIVNGFGVKMGAVDCSDDRLKKWCKRESLRSMDPTLLAFLAPPVKNPYRKRMSRAAAMLRPQGGAINSRGLKRTVLEALPDHTKPLEGSTGVQGIVDSLDANQDGPGRAHLMFISERKKTSPMLKAVAMSLRDRAVDVWTVNTEDADLALEDLGYIVADEDRGEAFDGPVLILMDPAGEWSTFEGDHGDREAIVEWVAEHSEEVPPETTSDDAEEDGAAAKDASPAAGDTNDLYKIDAKVYKEQVIKGKPAWVVVFVPAGQTVEEAVPEWQAMIAKGGGQLDLAWVSCDDSAELCKEKNVSDAVVLEAWPYGVDEKEDYGAEPFFASDAGKAIDAAGNTVPEIFQRATDPSDMEVQGFVSLSMHEKKMAMIVLSKKNDVGLSLRLLAEDFIKDMTMLFVSQPSAELQQQFGARKLPRIVLLTPTSDTLDYDKMRPDGKAEVAMSVYNPKLFRGYKFEGLKAFVMNSMAQKDMGSAIAADQQRKKIFENRHGRDYDIVNPLFGDESDLPPLEVNVGSRLLEMTPDLSDDFDHCSKSQPCAMLLTDGLISSRQVDLLEEVKEKVGARVPINWAHADGACHRDFAEAFDSHEMLPAFVVWSGKKSFYSRYVGGFNVDDMADFVKSSMRGGGRSIATAGKPTMEDVGVCARESGDDDEAAEEPAEVDPELDDLMAEIRAEEEAEARRLQEEVEREQKERKAKDKEEKAEADKKKKRKKKKKKKKKKKGSNEL